MKLKEKIKKKINTFKSNTSRFQVLSLDEWLNANGLQENAQNRALYTQYRLDIDEKNKQQDKNLSRFIGSALFLVVFLVIFSVMCCQSVGAVSVNDYYDQNISDNYYFLSDANSMFEYSYISVNSDYNFAFVVAWAQSSDYIQQGFTFSIVNTDLYVKYIDDNITLTGTDTEKNNQIYDFIAQLSFTHNFVVPNTIWLYQNSYYNIYKSYKDNYNSIYNDGYNHGYDIGETDGYNDGYNDGYVQGETDGYNDGYDIGETDGYNDGYGIGKTDGYNIGYLKGTEEGETLKKGIFAIFDAPLQTLHSLLNFEVLGINFYSIFTFILTLALLGILTKTILGFFV